MVWIGALVFNHLMTVTNFKHVLAVFCFLSVGLKGLT